MITSPALFCVPRSQRAHVQLHACRRVYGCTYNTPIQARSNRWKKERHVPDSAFRAVRNMSFPSPHFKLIEESSLLQHAERPNTDLQCRVPLPPCGKATRTAAGRPCAEGGGGGGMSQHRTKKNSGETISVVYPKPRVAITTADIGRRRNLFVCLWSLWLSLFRRVPSLLSARST